MQSDRFTILLGPAQKSFQVPQDLLIRRSSVFKKMCHPPYKESIERVIRLPEEKPSTFEDFFIWLHAFEPCVTLDCMDSVINLAIFAEKYHVCHLKNQTSDVIRTALSENRWKVTPEAIATVYNNVPAGTILRQICFLGFAVSCTVATWRRRNEGNNHYAKWETAFCNCPDLGWDYFLHIQTGQGDTSSTGFGGDASTVSLGGACRFHDHSDIAGWVRKNCSKCPYPHGAPVDMLPVEEDGVEEQEEEQVKEEAAEEYVAAAEAVEDAEVEYAASAEAVEDTAVEYAAAAEAVEDAEVEYTTVAEAVEDALEEYTAAEEAVVEDAAEEGALDAVVQDV
jgi:hypothetical protein